MASPAFLLQDPKTDVGALRDRIDALSGMLYAPSVQR